MILSQAEEAGDSRTALRAIGQARANLELCAKLLVAAEATARREGTLDFSDWTTEDLQIGFIREVRTWGYIVEKDPASPLPTLPEHSLPPLKFRRITTRTSSSR